MIKKALLLGLGITSAVSMEGGEDKWQQWQQMPGFPKGIMEQKYKEVNNVPEIRDQNNNILKFFLEVENKIASSKNQEEVTAAIESITSKLPTLSTEYDKFVDSVKDKLDQISINQGNNLPKMKARVLHNTKTLKDMVTNTESYDFSIGRLDHKNRLLHVMKSEEIFLRLKDDKKN